MGVDEATLLPLVGGPTWPIVDIVAWACLRRDSGLRWPGLA